MKLVLQRVQVASEFTMGSLSVDGVFECWTLEDVVRPDGVKVKGRTAIPYGTYKVGRSFSGRWQRLMLQILDVPGYDSIRIHGGNDEHDTEGCPLVGRDRFPNHIAHCAPVLADLEAKVFSALNSGDEITLEITRPQAGEVFA